LNQAETLPLEYDRRMSSDAAGWGDNAEFDRVLADLATTGTISAEGKRIDANHFDAIMAAARMYGRDKPVLRCANFRYATFEAEAHFDEARFEGGADFKRARFTKEVHFRKAIFEGSARFQDAVFGGYAHFPEATFGDEAVFLGADLKAGWRLGPSLVRRELVLDNASLGDLDLQVSTCRLSCKGTRFHGPTHLKVRWALIYLDEAVFDAVSALAFLPGEVPEEATLPCYRPTCHTANAKTCAMPRAMSFNRADVGNLTLAEIDLSSCHFDGTLRLDGMRLATVCPFDEPPAGWWWTDRLTIHEERRWRLSTAKGEEWKKACVTKSEAEDHHGEAERLAKIYRGLRKGREDEGNAPGAGDFYYGEMEMRRHGNGSRLERAVIFLYWLVSGYGLRASRALLALALTVLLFAVLFSTLDIRRGKTFRDDVVFSLQSTTSLLRAPDDEVLPTGGQLLEIGLRLLGPLFFGLALVSLRGRVKR
jgi:uncharacterized protein YjbI with pentapeptide repeats